MIATATTKPQVEALIAEGLTALIDPDDVFEVRILGVDDRSKRTDAGYFDDIILASKAIAKYDRRAAGIYIIPNVVNPALLARAANRIKEYPKSLTSDDDILRRRWLLIDADPVRPSDISSTDEEHESALARTSDLCEWLSLQGWPEAIKGDSGNGGHALYSIDLPNTPETLQLVERCLTALHEKFSDKVIKIDTTAQNAARVWKVYGTVAGKGDSIPERPHRRSRLISVPKQREAVSIDLLKALAATCQEANEPHRAHQQGASAFDVEQWLKSHNIAVEAKKQWRGGALWKLEKCHFSDDHTDGAWVAQFPSGAIAAGCHHDRCKDKGWAQLRAMYEAKREDQPAAKIANLPATAQAHVNGNGKVEGKAPLAQLGNFVEYSDLATAEFAYSLYEDEVAYTLSHGWMRNVGTHLTTDQAEAHAQRCVNAALRQQASNALANGNTELLKRSIPDTRTTRAVLYQFKSLVTISTSELDGEPHLLNTLSGVLDYRSGDLVTGEMSNRFTYCVQTEYKPKAHILETPLYVEKLQELFNKDIDTISFLERALGYGITGETKEELLIWLQGQRRSGKGTLLNTVQELLGPPLAMSLAMKSLTTDSDDPQHFALAPLRPARFVVASESKQHQRLDSGLLKWITGRDTIQVAHKGKDPFQMKPQFKLFVMSNYLPNIDAGDNAMHGRVKIIKMPNSYYGVEDKDLKTALLTTEQRELLLSLLVTQAGLYYKLGMVIPKDVEARAEEVRRAANPVYGWMGETVIHKPGHTESLDDWYQSYCAWCEDWGYKPTQKGWFARTLNDAGYPTKTDRPRDENGKQKRIVTVINGQLDN